PGPRGRHRGPPPAGRGQTRQGVRRGPGGPVAGPAGTRAAAAGGAGRRHPEGPDQGTPGARRPAARPAPPPATPRPPHPPPPRPRAERPQTEIKRLDQLAADRLSEETTSQWGLALAVDASPAAQNLAKLLESYYRELIDLEEKEENLKKQRAEVEQLVGLTRKEAALLKGTLPLIEKQVAQYAAAREEELVLVKARLKPDQADELLKGYQARTGK